MSYIQCLLITVLNMACGFVFVTKSLRLVISLALTPWITYHIREERKKALKVVDDTIYIKVFRKYVKIESYMAFSVWCCYITVTVFYIIVLTCFYDFMRENIMPFIYWLKSL